MKIDLLADTIQLEPGRPFRLAARVRIEPHWHIYWENPGEGGISTRVQFEAPSGFEVRPKPFPGPRRFIMPGEIINYGYEGEVVFFAEVEPPQDLVPDQEHLFRVKADWLVCKDICRAGEGASELVLNAGEKPASPSSGATPNRDLFARHWELLPRDLDELLQAKVAASGRGFQIRWSGNPLEPAIEFSVPEAEVLDFFPCAETSLEPIEPNQFLTGNAEESARLRVSFRRVDYGAAEDKDHAVPSACGLLQVRLGDRTAFYAVEDPWPYQDANSGKDEGN